jgi:predicted permease
MGIGVIAGRDFTAVDRPRSASTIVITESLARDLWSNASPIGQRVLIGCQAPEPSVVIGVVRDSVVREVGEPPQPRFYRPFARQYDGGLTAILLETGPAPATMVGAVRQTLLAMGSNIRVYAVQPLSTYIDQSFTPVRWMATVLTGFGLLALVLAAIGLYGVMAYRVSLRTQEIGIRMALGARVEDVFRLMVGQGMKPALLGVALGLFGAAALTRLMKTLLFEMSATDPLTFIAVALLLTFVALLACWIPARRATKVDPMLALRVE